MKAYRLWLVACLWFLASTATTSVNAGTHTVRADETLYCLAGEYLGDPHRWPELLALNPQIGSPEDLEIGTRLQLPADALVEAAADRRICQPHRVSEGWRPSPTAKLTQVADRNPINRPLSLVLDQRLHAKPAQALPTVQATSPDRPQPTTSPTAEFREALPREARRLSDIYTAADGAFYIVTGGNVVAQRPATTVPLGRRVVMDRSLFESSQD